MQPEYLDDPSVLSKEQLKSELLARNVELPSGNPPKDVFVRLYLKELTAQNGRPLPASLDAFSSDEELPSPVLSSRNHHSSGSKSTSRADKVLLGELDVTALTDQSLRDALLRHGLDVGPIVASTRKLYEKKLQKLLDDHASSEVILPDTKVTSNGSADSELYSDQDDEVTETQPDPEPIPLVERPPRSRPTGPLPAHDQSMQNTPVIAAGGETIEVEEDDSQKELLPSDLSSPGITATCRRPIKGAADRPVKPRELWEESLLFSPNISKTASDVETRLTNRLASVPRSTTSNSSSSSKPVFSAPPAGQMTSVRCSAFPWMKLLLLALLAALFFFVYQTMEPITISPFDVAEVGGASDGKA